MKNEKVIGIFARQMTNVMGGMEKQALGIASFLINHGYRVLIITLDQEKIQPFFNSNPKIEFINLNIGHPAKKANIIQKYSRQRKVFKILKQEKIKIAICFMTGAYWYSLVPCKILRIPIVLAERNGPSIYRLTRVRKYRSLIFVSMIFCKSIIVQFEAYVQSYPLYLRHKIKSIPNYVEVGGSKIKRDDNKFKFIFAGRLCYQKQILELAKAFIKFNHYFPDTLLDIYGYGELMPELRAIIDSSSAHEFIKIYPPFKEPKQILVQYDVLVAPSIWEGFSNSVSEALANGIPVAGFNDCEGIRDLIDNNFNGWLIERRDSEESILELLKYSYSCRQEIEKYSLNAKNSVIKYQRNDIYENWSNLSLSLLAE